MEGISGEQEESVASATSGDQEITHLSETNPFSFRALTENFLAARNKPFGEAFEYYYRPMLKAKQGSSIPTIAAEALAEVCERDNDKDHKQWLDQQAQESKQLASELYNLVQNKWERNINVYLRVLDRYLEKKVCDRAKTFLDHTKQSFIDQYSEILLERGESIELIDQITRRTGEDTIERLDRVLTGKRPLTVAFKLWGKYLSHSPSRWVEIDSKLNNLTDQQIREIRLSFGRIPAMLMAGELNRLLSLTVEEETTKLPEIVAEQVRYLLYGRSAFELEKLIFEYDEKFHHGEQQESLRNKFENVLSKYGVENPLALFEGFSSKELAQELVYLLDDNDELLEVFPEVEYQDTQEGVYPISETLKGKFIKRSLLNSKPQTWERELEVHHKIWPLLDCLSIEQYEDVFHELQDEYGIELDADLHEYLLGLGARTQVTRIRRSLELSRSVRDLLLLLRGLNAIQLRDLRDAWTVVEGGSIEEAIRNRVESFYPVSVPREVNELLDAYLGGMYRLPLKIDLLEPWHGQGPEFEMQLLPEPSDVIVGHAAKIHSLLTQSKDQKELLDSLYAEIQPLTLDDRYDLERAYASSQNGVTLTQSIAQHAGRRAFVELDALLSGVDAREAAKSIASDFSSFFLLRGSDPEFIEIVCEYCEEKLHLDLLSEINSFQGSEIEWECRDVALMIYRAPLAAELYGRVFAIGDAISETTMQPLFQLAGEFGYEHVRAFERAFDRSFGPFRKLLKERVTSDKLSERLFVRIILLLEGLSPDLVSTIEDALDGNDMPQLRDIFLKHSSDISTLEEGYNLLHKDKSLRRSIDSSRAAVKEKNRTLLYLDGFYPEAVASEIHDIFGKYNGKELELKLLEVLADPLNEDTPNERIPNDLFWIAEMYLQIRLSYIEANGKRILEECLERDLSPETLFPIIQRLYGEKCFEHVEALNELDIAKITGEEFAASVVDLFKETSPRMLYGVFDLYDVIARFTSRTALRKRLDAFRELPGIEELLSKLDHSVPDVDS